MAHARVLRLAVVAIAACVAGAFAFAPCAVDARDEDEQVAAFFAPGGNIEPAIRDLLNDAKREVLIGMYLFTSRPLAEAVARAKKRGVDVRVILDGEQKSQRHSKYGDLRRAGVPMRLMRLGKTSQDQDIKFHHKFLVIDGEIVETGSFNWTQQADDQNWENAVVIRSRRLAAQFKEQFEKAWTEAEPDEPVRRIAAGDGDEGE